MISLIIPALFNGYGSSSQVRGRQISGKAVIASSPAAKLRVESLTAEVGAAVSFEEVLLVGAGDGVKVGARSFPARR